MRTTAHAVLALVVTCAGCSRVHGVDGDAAPRLVDGSRPSDAALDAWREPDAGRPIDGSAGTDARSHDACDPITEDASAVDELCRGDLDPCPAGYTCHAYVGIVTLATCQILCERDCDCPADHGCRRRADKVGTWAECDPIES